MKKVTHKNVTLYIDKQLIKKLKHKALEIEISISSIVENLISKFLGGYNDK